MFHSKNWLIAAIMYFSLGFLFLPTAAFAQSSAPEYPAYGSYNGFLNQLNILECDNLNNETLNSSLELFSEKGTLLKRINVSTRPNGSSHVILNDQLDIKDTYGTFRVSVDNQAETEFFNCRTVFYRLSESSSPKSYDFTYAMPLKNSSTGDLSGIYNSINPLGKTAPTQNWLSIVNTSLENFNASIEVYNQEGEIESIVPVHGLAPFSRIDLPLGHTKGQKSGVYRVLPVNKTQNFQAFVMRYGLDDDDTAFSFAFPLYAESGSCDGGRLQASTMASTSTQNWLALANSGSEPISVNVEVNDRAGNELKTLPLTVGPFQISNVHLNTIIDPAGTGNVGSVKLDCSGDGSNLLAQSAFYGTHDLNSISWAYVEQSSDAQNIEAGQKLSFAINTFLNMGNWIKLVQNEERTAPLEFSFFDSNGRLQLFGEHVLQPSSTLDFDVHSNFPSNMVGSANFELVNDSVVSGYLLRTIPDNAGRIGNIIYIPGSILPERAEIDRNNPGNSNPGSNGVENAPPGFNANNFGGNAQSLRTYRNALSDQEIDYFLTRTGFGGTFFDKSRLIELGLDESVSLMLNSQNPSLSTYIENPSDPERGETKVAWLQMMVEGNHPFHEKMALIWHDLFATSCRAGGVKFNCLTHIELLRRNALGNFRTLSQEIAIDFAMLEWLNGTLNSVTSPDENYSREWWELFSLGESSLHTGPYRLYNNEDIAESSRAFTGWQSYFGNVRNTVGFNEDRFDDGQKVLWEGTPFEARGNFNNTDVINLTLDTRPESAEWIVKRLFSSLVHDNPSTGVVNELAETLRSSNWEIKPVLEKILKSEAMFSEDAKHKRVKDAATYLIGFLRRTEIPYETDRFDYHFVNEHTGFEPTRPLSVDGWPLNKYQEADNSVYFLSWLTGNVNYISRLLDHLIEGDIEFDHQTLIPKSRFQPTPAKIVDELSELMGVELTGIERNALIRYIGIERNHTGTEENLDLVNNKDGLGTKIRGTLWLLSQHRNYITF